MIQYIIAAGIGAFLGSQSKKSKKSYAEGGKVELHKHPQGHWMLINPLSFQVGEDFVNEQDAKDYAWNNRIELTNSSYAKGGKLEAEWLVTLEDEDGFELDEVVFAKSEDEAIVKAEELNPNTKGVFGVIMLTDYDGKKIDFAKGGSTSTKKEKDEVILDILFRDFPDTSNQIMDYIDEKRREEAEPAEWGDEEEEPAELSSEEQDEMILDVLIGGYPKIYDKITDYIDELAS